MKSGVARFLDSHGNTVKPNGRHYWTFTCVCCKAQKMIKDLQPNVIIKRMTQAGWSLGSNPEKDLCPNCVNVKPEKPKEEQPIIICSQPIHVEIESGAEFYDQMGKCLDMLKEALIFRQYTEAIRLVEIASLGLDRRVENEYMLSNKGKKKKRKKEPEPPPEDETEYQKWLAELEKQQ